MRLVEDHTSRMIKAKAREVAPLYTCLHSESIIFMKHVNPKLKCHPSAQTSAKVRKETLQAKTLSDKMLDSR